MDEVIGEVETDKTALSIQAPCAGVIEEFLVEDGSTIHKGDQLVKINISGGGAPAPKTETTAAPAPKTEAVAEPVPTATPMPPGTISVVCVNYF